MIKHQSKIVEYDNSKHRDQVVNLWQTVFGYEAAHNSPEVVIDMKIQNRDGLFFVAEENQSVLATIMAGYDGHRGWIYSIAVHPDYQKRASVPIYLLLHKTNYLHSVV